MVFGLWCLVISHILVRVHEDQRMFISHSLKQVVPVQFLGKCDEDNASQYYDGHNASITMADVVAIAQLQ